MHKDQGPVSGEFPEDHLKLLGPEVALLDPQTFYDRVLGFYQPRTAGGKAKEPELKGKKLKNPTKKLLGTYEIRFPTALGERTAQFTFCKRNLFPKEFIKPVIEHLICAEQKLRDFLAKKKFSVSPCLDDEMRLQKLSIGQPEKKETKNGSDSS